MSVCEHMKSVPVPEPKGLMDPEAQIDHHGHIHHGVEEVGEDVIGMGR